MEIDTLITVGGYILTPISGVVSWFAAKRVRNNETLNKLQETIDSLVDKNCKLISDMTELRAENSQLKNELMAVRNANAELKRGQEELKKGTKMMPWSRLSTTRVRRSKEELEKKSGGWLMNCLLKWTAVS